MPPEARVTSIAALEEFRARLIVFIERATVAVDDALDEVTRTRLWLTGEQRIHWENQLRRRSRELENVEQELFSARIGNLREANTTKQLAVRKARLAVVEAREKLARIKKWNLHYDTEVAPPAAQVEKLRTLFSSDLRRAVALLGRSLDTLDAYSDRAIPLTQTQTTSKAATDQPAASAGPPLDQPKKTGGRP